MTTFKLATSIQNKYRAYKEAEIENDRLSNLITEKLGSDIDEKLEAEWDEAYKVYWSLREDLVQTLMNTLNISRQTVNRMICTDKFEELMSKTII